MMTRDLIEAAGVVSEASFVENEEKSQNYEKAATAYRTAYVNNVSGFEILIELYKGMIGNIEQAKLAYQAGQLEKMCRLNEKTTKILLALQSHLDFEQGGDAAVFLNKFYNSIFASLARILRSQHPEDDFDQMIVAMREVYQRWCDLSTEQNGICKD